METHIKIQKDSGLKQNEPQQMKKEFEDFIISGNHPCVMAQSVFSLQRVDFHTYEDLGSKETAEKMLEDLKKYIAAYDFESNDFYTFIAAFRGRKHYSEKEFEEKLWLQLKFLHESDDQIWDPEVSSNPEDKNFSFSLAGKAFYMVGMHPNSSRKSRQSPFPSIAINLHHQFEKLREMDVYQNIRNKIRERDIALQGNINPMLEDFGKNSEARQYSGRKVESNWKCPFHQKK